MKQRILVIEDDASQRELTGLHLTRAGYDVALAEDGLAGAAALLRERFDAVVSDVQMPFLDGLELLKAVKADRALGGLPVILVSGSLQALDRPEAALASACLLKPVFATELIAALAAALTPARKAA